MRSISGFVGVVLLVVASISSADHAAKVHYVANEGFLIEVGAEKVLIDALFDNQSIAWCHVPDETTLRKMENAEAPFDGVELILVTHAHQDHFSSGILIEDRTRSDSCRVGAGIVQSTRNRTNQRKTHIVMEDKGHEFPDNFDEVLREAVKKIYQ